MVKYAIRLQRYDLFMKRSLPILFFLMLFISVMASAGPVRNKSCVLVQPDGTSFKAVISGDEFFRIKMTADGCAVIQDENGWWCYAGYDADGGKFSSGCKVGKAAPSEVLSRSRDIPYARLAQLAADARRKAPVKEALQIVEPTLTKSGEEPSAPALMRGIVIPAQFANMSFRYTREDFDALLNADSYDRDGAVGSAKEYFNDQFGDSVDFVFDVADIVTLSKDLDYYGGNKSGKSVTESDKAPEEMVMEACRLADEKVDFSKYDQNGDGEVDNVFIFFAGGDEAEGAGDDCIWSHAWYVKDGAGKNLVLDGMVINRYACAAELIRYIENGKEIKYRFASIGTFCHEFSHVLGLWDMYDTDYQGSGGESEALWWSTSIMDGGSHNNMGNTPPYYNALEREMTGISQAELIEKDGVYTLEPIHKGGKAYRLNTDVENEFFLIECRAEESWDSYIGGNGMLIYHVDMTDRPAGFSDLAGTQVSALRRWRTNEVNCNPAHQCTDLIEALPGAGDVRNVFFPSGRAVSLSPEDIRYWSGELGPYSITDIRRDGDKVVFNVIGGDEETTPPDAVSLSYEKFQDAAIVSFESSRPYSGEAVVTWGQTGKETASVNVSPYEEGKYAVVIDGLNPRTSYTVNIQFSINGISGKKSSISFMTSSDTNGYPYLNFKSARRNPDGAFYKNTRLSLRVNNAVGAAGTVWTFNGKKVTVDGSGYYYVKEDGTLKVEVMWEDGSTDVIVKEIKVVEE